MRALLSVYDKTGIVEFAVALHELGVDLVSSGGTASAIAAAGIPVTDVAEITGVPAILGHRVVTLHPKIHGGLLFDRDDPEHVVDVERYDIQGIDLVVANLYPFSAKPSIEMIDIGGPAMVRAAAKNHAFVGVIVDPTDYEAVLAELRDTGALSDGLRRRLARTAFATTAAYDAEILAWIDQGDAAGTTSVTEPAELPPTIELVLERSQVLRYGENPHQVGARYSVAGQGGWWQSAVQHGGKEMSYLNVFDADAAQRVHQAPWSSSTPIPAGSRWPTTSRRRTREPTSATRSRPSVASSPSTDP
jgi:phosphoribosylaminoimidazolecarboxamide formyltransferase/IMP cyclohydrolase